MHSDWAFHSRKRTIWIGAALLFMAARFAPAQAIFDGKTLAGWDGDPAFWRAENGAIVGETKPERDAETEHVFDLARWIAG